MAPRGAASEGSLGGLTLGGVLGLLVLAAGLVIGLRPLGDNSFFTHLATGRLILDQGSVPSTDPYTFTAAGEPWVVQSWLMSVVYAAAEKLAGLGAVRIVSGLLAMAVAGLAWRILRPADAVLGRLGVAALFIAVAAGLWAERPLMVGLVGFALVVLAGEGGLGPRWLLPVGWLWVNTHGSFPLGLAYLATVVLGRRLDGERPDTELRALAWAAFGMALGVIGPLGFRALTFPLDLLQRQDLLATVVEWRAPTFDSFSQRAWLVQLVVAVVLLTRRPTFRNALILAVFGAAALLGARNLTVSSIALLVPMAAGLSSWAGLSSRDRSGIVRPLGALAVALAAILVTVRVQQPDLRLGQYPVNAVAFLETHEVALEEHRLAAPDHVGNFLELVYGEGRRVFYDDRFDMFPEAVSEAHLALLGGTPSMRTKLADLAITLAALPRDRAGGQVLLADPGWRALYVDETWTLLCRRGADLGGRLDRC